MIQFDSISEFWNMGGYGFYVWLAFGSGLLCVAMLWIGSWWTKKRLLAQVVFEQKRQQRIKQANEKTLSY